MLLSQGVTVFGNTENAFYKEALRRAFLAMPVRPRDLQNVLDILFVIQSAA